MKVAAFISPGAEQRDGVRKAMETVLPANDVEILSSVASLRERLLRPPGYPPPIVLLAPGCDDFLLLGQLVEQLHCVDAILVLPDGKRLTIARGHILRPRLLGHGLSFLEQFPAVLERMLMLRDRAAAETRNGDAPTHACRQESEMMK